MSVLTKLLYHPEINILLHLYYKRISKYSDFHRYTSGRGATYRAVENLLEMKLIEKIDYGVYQITKLGYEITKHIVEIRKLIDKHIKV